MFVCFIFGFSFRILFANGFRIIWVDVRLFSRLIFLLTSPHCWRMCVRNTTMPTEANVACVGSWSPASCQADCGDRTYAVTTPVSGLGYPCSAADGATEKCSPGDGACPAVREP